MSRYAQLLENFFIIYKPKQRKQTKNRLHGFKTPFKYEVNKQPTENEKSFSFMLLETMNKSNACVKQLQTRQAIHINTYSLKSE